MTIGKKELNLRLAPETFGRNAALDPAQIRSRAVYFFLFLKERKFTGGWVLFRLCTSALHIKVTGFEPMALCTQNRCADQTALHLVSPPEHMVWIYPIEKDSNRSRPPRGTGRREPPLLGNKPTILFDSRLVSLAFSFGMT